MDENYVANLAGGGTTFALSQDMGPQMSTLFVFALTVAAALRGTAVKQQTVLSDTAAACGDAFDRSTWKLRELAIQCIL
eukprot:gene9610-biopygen3425